MSKDEMINGFKSMRIVDNFYQTSSFFPMPTIEISTIDENGFTNIGSYSLCFPYYIAGKGYYAMVLECRNSSNTCRNLLTTGKCALNFLPDDRKYFKEAVRLGFSGDTPEEKMKDCMYTLVDGKRAIDDPKGKYPKVVKEAFQVFECTWVKELDGAENDKVQDEYPGPYHDFNGITSEFGAHFILKIDNILMQEKYYDTIINGVGTWGFPRVPVDYGYRDSKNFWSSRSRKPYPELLPMRQTTLDSVKYAADRVCTDVKFTDEALAVFVKAPRIFLPTILKGCVAWARERGITLLTKEHIDIINDKRSKEKNK